MPTQDRQSPAKRFIALLLLPILLLGGFPPGHASHAGAIASPDLSVRAVSPAPSTGGVAAATTIMVAFDRPVAALTALGESPALAPLHSIPALRGSGRWVTSSIYAWNAKYLHAATTYRLSIAAGLKAIDGTRLQSTYAWSFTTVLPRLVDVYPADGYQYALPDPAVSLIFNQQMDHASVQSAFHLRDATGKSVPGVFSWSAGALRFRPLHALTRSAMYTARLDAGARSAEGPLPMPTSLTWSFAVAPYLHVVGTTPAANSSDADTGDGVIVEFNAPIDEKSALTNLRLSPDVPNRYVTEGDDDLSLHIYGQFAPSTAYTIGIRAGLRARAGDTLGRPFTLHFVSASLPPQLYFVSGSVAVYEATRPITLSLQAVNPGTVDFTLYTLDQQTFVDDMSDVYDLTTGTVAGGQEVGDIVVRPDAPLNKTIPLQVVADLPGHKALAPGYYLVVATSNASADARDVELLLVTRTGLTIKVSHDQVLVWATDLKTGAPIANLPVQVLATNLSQSTLPREFLPRLWRTSAPDSQSVDLVLGRATTNARGLATLQFSGYAQSLLQYGQIVVAAARSGDAVVAGSSWSSGISPYDFGISYASSQPAIRMNIATDRSIYRPGQMLHVRGVARADDDASYSLVTGPVRLVLTDGTGKTVARKTVLLDSFGAFHADLCLAAGASLGNYSLSAAIGTQSSSASFQVAEYKEPNYSVSIGTPASTYSLGQTILATVGVSYYFGGPVAHAKVHWSVLGYTYAFFTDLVSDYSFGAYDPAADDLGFGVSICATCGASYTLYQGNATTGTNGTVLLRIPAKLPKGLLAQSYSVEADVTDIDNQPVAGRTSVAVFSSAVQLGLQADHQIVAPGAAQRIHVVSLADDGTTPVDRLPVRVRVFRRDYHNVVVKQEDGSVSQQYVPADTLLKTLTVKTDAHGMASFPFAAPMGGQYHIVADARDKYGNTSQSSIEIYAGGETPIDWSSQQQGHIRLITDKRTYQSGDVAHIMVTTPYSNATALITIERGRILNSSVRRLAGTATVLDIPVESSYLPDTYVSVVIERGSAATGRPDWRLGYARIHVDSAERALRISVTPAKSRVAPGQTLPIKIRVVDHAGEPVRSQIGLSLVDEANLALTGNSGTGSGLLDTFYGDRELGVTTSDTLNLSPVLLLSKHTVLANRHAYATDGAGGEALSTPSAARSANQSASAPGNVFAAKSPVVLSLVPAVSIRQNFQDTAYWNAAVVTGADGSATVDVPLPDNTTTWKILGQGVTASSLVGAASTSVMATKDLLLRPIAPRFFDLGDKARIGATVNNASNRHVEAHLRLLLADGSPKLTPTVIGDKLVKLEPGGELDVTWPITITALGTATVLVEAVDTSHPATNDAVQLALPVRENSTPETVATSGQAGADTREQVRIPANAEPNEGSLTVILEPTLASGLRVGADFLARYPYESSVDLASQILGETELGRLPARASVLTKAERGHLGADVAGRLSSLYDDQHGDGGFGWWIDDPYSSPYITVYVVEALAGARDLGYKVSQSVLDNAVSYLIANMQSPAATNNAAYDANLQASLVYSVTLAGRPADVADLAAQLYDVRDLLATYAKAQLIQVFAPLNNAAAHARVLGLLSDLTSAAKTSGASVHWEEPSYDWADLDSDIATSATVLDALVKTQPDSPLIPSAVRWLMAARTADAWQSSYATAVSVRGLVDYVFASGELNADYHYTVRLNGALWGSGSVGAANLAQNRTLTRSLGREMPAGSTQNIAFSRDVRPNNGNLSYVIRLRYFRPVDQIEAAGAGLSMSRAYLTADGRSASNGSTIRVQIRLTTSQDLFYLTLEDPLPAGAEAVDSSLQTTSQLAQIQNTSKIPAGTTDLSWYVTHTDLRDDRTVLFLSYLPAGSYQYTYLIHCTTQGIYHTLPAHAQQDYFPEVFGRSSGSYFTVR